MKIKEFEFTFPLKITKNSDEFQISNDKFVHSGEQFTVSQVVLVEYLASIYRNKLARA